MASHERQMKNGTLVRVRWAMNMKCGPVLAFDVDQNFDVHPWSWESVGHVNRNEVLLVMGSRWRTKHCCYSVVFIPSFGKKCIVQESQLEVV